MAKERSQKTVQETQRYHVPNLERAVEILEFLAREARPCGISEIAERLEFPKNSVFRIVSTLFARGYLRRDGASKHYALGAKLLWLGHAAVAEAGLVEKSIDILRELRDETNESAFIGVIEGNEGVVLESAESTQQVKVLVGIGTRFPLHTAAPAKAMIAHMSEKERDKVIDKIDFVKYTDTTITSAAQFKKELQQIRNAGYALDLGEHANGIRCVGAAILNHMKQPIAGFWVTGPAFRMSDAQLRVHGETVARAAERVSARFGYGE